METWYFTSKRMQKYHKNYHFGVFWRHTIALSEEQTKIWKTLFHLKFWQLPGIFIRVFDRRNDSLESDLFNESVDLVHKIICSWNILIHFSNSTHWLNDQVAEFNSSLKEEIINNDLNCSYHKAITHLKKTWKTVKVIWITFMVRFCSFWSLKASSGLEYLHGRVTGAILQNLVFHRRKTFTQVCNNMRMRKQWTVSFLCKLPF